MIIKEDLQRPIFVPLQTISDERGFIIPFCDFLDAKLIKRFYFVENYSNEVLRGLHYHKAELKIFGIISGAAKFNCLSIPEQLVSKNNESVIKSYIHNHLDDIMSFTMSENHFGLLAVPPLYACGWISLRPETRMVVISNKSLLESKQDFYFIDPELFTEDKWKVQNK